MSRLRLDAATRQRALQRLAAAPEVLTLRELAQALEQPPRTLRAWYRQGLLPGWQAAPDRCWRGARVAIEQWLRDPRYWEERDPHAREE